MIVQLIKALLLLLALVFIIRVDDRLKRTNVVIPQPPPDNLSRSNSMGVPAVPGSGPAR